MQGETNMTCTILQFLCRRVTEHRWRKLTAYSVGIEPVEYHYTCRVCRKHFWNYDCKNAELQKLIQKVSDREVKNSQETEVLDFEVKNSIRKNSDNCEQGKPYPQEQANVRIEEGEE